MFSSSLRSITRIRAVGRPTPFALSTQTRSLYFCGPKAGDHDPDLPISQHYHARSHTTGSDRKLTAESPLATVTLSALHARSATPTPTPTLRISVTHTCSQSERHTMSSTSKLEAVRRAIGQLEATTHDDATTYNTAIVIVKEIARLEVMLRKGEVKGKQGQELQKVREDMEELKSLFERMERRKNSQG